MVFCIDVNHIAPSIQMKSVHSNDFTFYQYYNDDRLVKADGLEDAFNKGFESKYNDVLKAIEKESILDNETKKNLINWLWLSQLRSPLKRDQIQQELNFNHFWSKISEPNKLPYLTQEELQECLEIASKTIHLNEFIDDDQRQQSLEKFILLSILKEWVILKSPINLPFCTNDKPGFAIGYESFEMGKFPYESLSSLDQYATVYFVLSPNLCFKMSPFLPNTPSEQNAWKSDIKYEEVRLEEWQLIQEGVSHTPYRFVISNQNNY